MRRVATEHPQLEQWRLLLRFAYPRNVREHLKARNLTATDDVVETVTGSILQAHAYYEATAIANLHISPLLLYYGSINLLHACASLSTGTIPGVSDHGMQVVLHGSRVADATVRVVNEKTGALTAYATSNSRDSDDTPPAGSTWSLSELLGSIPDLFRDFVSCYPGIDPHTVPIEIVKTRHGVIERIAMSDLAAFADHDSVFRRMSKFKKTYMSPQAGSKHVILRRRMDAPGAPEDGTYSISGCKHMPIAHDKASRLVTPQPAIAMLMSLFALGFVSRYRPAFWTPFVRSDTTGERLFIERLPRSTHTHT